MLTIHNWDDTSGYILVNQNGNEFRYNLYGENKCNTFLASVYEYTGDDGKTYEQLMWFFVDENHAKIMLGLKKDQSGEKCNHLAEITKITIFKSKCGNWKKLISLFAEAFSELTIEIREE